VLSDAILNTSDHAAETDKLRRQINSASLLYLVDDRTNPKYSSSWTRRRELFIRSKNHEIEISSDYFAVSTLFSPSCIRRRALDIVNWHARGLTRHGSTSSTVFRRVKNFRLKHGMSLFHWLRPLRRLHPSDDLLLCRLHRTR
jgi:hypothetical protein